MAYSDIVLTDTPIAYYRLNGGTSRLTDTSGNSYTLTANGTDFTNQSSLVGDASDGACQFNSAGDGGDFLYLASSTPLVFTGTSAFTVELWCDPVVSDTDFRRLVGWSDDATASSNAYYVYHHSTVGFAFVRRAAGTDNGPNVVPSTYDRVHHIVGVFSGSEVWTYVDTVEGTHEASGSQGAYAGTFRVGQGQYDSSACKAIVDEVAIYSGVLSEARISAHYQAGLGQILLPDADVAAGGWVNELGSATPLWSKLADGSDSTYIAGTAA